MIPLVVVTVLLVLSDSVYGARISMTELLKDRKAVRVGKPVPCPPNSEGPNNCQCKIGFRGEVKWDKVNQVWKSTCSKERCPGVSTGHPNCQCPTKGYKGFVEWYEKKKTYRGFCSRIHCPWPAIGHPDCTCPQGYTGSIAWNDAFKVYTGACTPTWTYLIPKEKVAHQSCRHLLTNPSLCKIAADELGIRHTGVKVVQQKASLPPGCFLSRGSLQFSLVNSSHKRQSDGRHHYERGVQPICGSSEAKLKTCKWDLFAAAGPKFHDVQQGDIGTCYFLASIAAVAHFQPQLIEEMFVSKGCVTYTKHNQKCAFPFVYEGITYDSCTRFNSTAPWCATKVDSSNRLASAASWDFCSPNVDEECKSDANKYERMRTTWQINGQLVTVAIDDKVPANELGHPHFVKYNSGHHFWPLVLEKAWAKIYGSFKNVELGLAVESLMAITKAPVNQITNIYLMSLKQVWRQLMYVISMSSPCVANTRKIEGGELYGLPSDHSFTFIDARRLRGGRYYVQLYNPWGRRNGYNGKLRSMKQHDDTFWMTLQEFHKAFFELNYVSYHPGYRSSSQAIPVKGSYLQALLRFDMDDDSQFWYMVTWPTARLVIAKSNCTHESHVMPKVNSHLQFFGDTTSGNAWSTNFSQATIGHAWRRIRGQGGKGYYRLKLEIDFGEITWVPEVSVVVFAKTEVKFNIMMTQDNSLYVDGTDDPFGVNNPINKECAAYVNRVKALDNHNAIRATGVDAKFPPEAKSIGSGNCGDPAQDKHTQSCEVYNHWTTFDNVACPQ